MEEERKNALEVEEEEAQKAAKSSEAQSRKALVVFSFYCAILFSIG